MAVAKAAKRLPVLKLAKGFATWADWHQRRAWRLDILRQALGALQHGDLLKGQAKWSEYSAERAQVMQVLRGALTKLAMRRLHAGMAAWFAYWELKLEENRLMAIAARSAASLRSPFFVAAFDAWKQLGALRRALHPSQGGGRCNPVAAICESLTKMLSNVGK